MIHIPDGYTCLCQPVDLGIHKLIKSWVSEKVQEWMTYVDGIIDTIAKEMVQNSGRLGTGSL